MKYYITDHLGSPVAIAGLSGTTVAQLAVSGIVWSVTASWLLQTTQARCKDTHYQNYH
jgi:hypothetical protein